MNKSDQSWERAIKNWRAGERRDRRDAERDREREQGKTEKPMPGVGIEREGRG